MNYPWGSWTPTPKAFARTNVGTFLVSAIYLSVVAHRATRSIRYDCTLVDTFGGYSSEIIGHYHRC
jgi:hypothetical protein